MPRVKKTKSEIESLASTNNSARPSLASLNIRTVNKDTHYFEIEKWGRFTARFFQIVLAILCSTFLNSQNAGFLRINGLYGAMQYSLIVDIFSIFVSSGLVGMYAIPFFAHKWQGRKVLTIESIFDLAMFTLIIIALISQAAAVKNTCSVDKSGDCDRYNFVMVFQGFSILAWFASIVFDGLSWYQGLRGETSQISPVTIRALMRK